MKSVLSTVCKLFWFFAYEYTREQTTELKKRQEYSYYNNNSQLMWWIQPVSINCLKPLNICYISVVNNKRAYNSMYLYDS